MSITEDFPEVTEVIEFNEFFFTIESIENNRIDKIGLTLRSEES